jgi:hypothetical protein
MNYAKIPEFSQYVEYITQGDNGAVIINAVPITAFELDKADPKQVTMILGDYLKVANIKDRAACVTTAADAKYDTEIPAVVFEQVNKLLVEKGLKPMDAKATYVDMLAAMKAK